MAEIAMLVAEEYERRVKINSMKPREEQEQEGSGLKLINLGFASDYVKGKIEVVEKWVSELEHKSPIGVAATNGFFSA